MRTLWSYEKESKAIKDAEDRVVLFGDDINEEVLETVVSMWNKKATDNAIQGFLDRSHLCTSEEGDYIVEQIGNYEKQVSSYTGKPEDAHMGRDTAVQMGDMTIQQPGMTEKPVGKLTTEEVLEMGKKVGEQIADAVLGQKKRQPRTTTAVKSAGKVDAKDLVARLQEQIELIQFVDGVCIADIPVGTPISKPGREILIALQKAVEVAKDTAVQNIQQL